MMIRLLTDVAKDDLLRRRFVDKLVAFLGSWDRAQEVWEKTVQDVRRSEGIPRTRASVEAAAVTALGIIIRAEKR